MSHITINLLHLDAQQGADEARSKSYMMKYDEQALQAATQRSAKSTNSTASSAGRQGGAMDKLRGK